MKIQLHSPLSDTSPRPSAPHSRRGRMAACLIAFAVALAVSPAPAAEQPVAASYTLGPEDRLAVRIGQWSRAEGLYTAWEHLSGTYIVGPDGNLSMPLLGPVAAEGRTPGELAHDLARRFAEELGLTDPMGVSIDIEEYRPIFITGGVNAPGPYPYQPGMTVNHALSLAGGERKLSSVFVRADRDALVALGESEVLRLKLWRAEATLARIEAELAGKDRVETPASLEGVPVAEQLMEIEREVLTARNRAFESSLEQIEGLETLLLQRIEALDKQIALRRKQVELAEEELERVQALTQKGLAVTSREVGRERTVAELQSSVLELQTSRLEAEQSLAEARRDRADLMTSRRKELVLSLSETRSESERLSAEIRTQQALFSEATRLGNGLVMEDSGVLPSFEIVRMVEGERTVIRGDKATELLPGDILEVGSPRLVESGEHLARQSVSD